MSFTDQVLESVAPWADSAGFWVTYNAAIASMFESVFSIVADSGDPNQTIVAVLSQPLSTAAMVTGLPVGYVTTKVTAGTEVTLNFSTSIQMVTLSADTHVGDTSIAIKSTQLNFAYPAGTPVQLAYFPGWSKLLDPLNCPDQFLPFLAQFNGTNVPVTLDAATARAKIAGESAQQRGTVASVRSAVQRNLSGTQSATILERTGQTGPDPYHFMVIVRPEEVVDVNALTNAVNDTKPGGIQWTLIQTDGWTIGQMEAQYATIAQLEAAFTTISGLQNNQPGR